MANSTTDIVAIGEGWFKKAPGLSTDAKDSIVQITPWIVLIFGIIGISYSISRLGLLFTFSSQGIGEGLHGYGTFMVTVVLYIVSSVLMLMAYPGTKAHLYRGWKLLFWSEVVNLIGNVISFNIIGVIIQVFAFYLLYQIKSYYK